MRIVCGALLYALTASIALGQSPPRVSQAASDSKELKRSARRMRIPEQQLKNLREVLKEATELALRLDPPSDQLPMVCGQWMTLDRNHAPETFERMLANLKDRAFRASDAESYSRISRVARGLLSMFLQVDPERAQQLAGHWPAPAAPLGDRAIKEHEEFQQSFQKNYAMALASRDPEKALPLLRAAENKDSDYSSRGMVVANLIRSGQQDEGLRLIDETIADYSQKATSTGLQSYLGFVSQIVHTAPERMQQALAPVSRMMNAPGASVHMGSQVQIGDQVVLLTSTESQILNMFRSLGMRPELLLRTLSSMPELKSKLDRYGGIDAFLNPANRGMPMPTSVPPPGANFAGSGIYYPSHPAMTRETGERIFRELKGKGSREPAAVRQRLQKEFSKPEQIQSLISIASISSYEDPELGTLCLEHAKTLLPQVQPLQTRAGALQQLISAYRNVEGEVDLGLIRDGFVLADQMREETKQKVASSAEGTTSVGGELGRQWSTGTVSFRSGGANSADYLEAALTAEYARQDFDAAMRFIRSLPDDTAKLTMYNQVLQVLRMPY